MHIYIRAGGPISTWSHRPMLPLSQAKFTIMLFLFPNFRNLHAVLKLESFEAVTKTYSPTNRKRICKRVKENGASLGQECRTKLRLCW